MEVSKDTLQAFKAVSCLVYPNNNDVNKPFLAY